jgi:FixJ family two-component response regulator
VISIVDDDSWVRSGLEALVQSLGYATRTFESAEQFIESRSIDETTCVITDLHMPGLSGLDLQSRLRREGHDTPIIFITAYPSEQHCSRAFANGAIGFLIKPLDEETLVACLARALAQQALPADASAKGA